MPSAWAAPWRSRSSGIASGLIGLRMTATSFALGTRSRGISSRFWPSGPVTRTHAGGIATGPAEARNQTRRNRIETDHKDNRDNGRRDFCSERCRRTHRDDESYWALDEFGRQSRKAVVLADGNKAGFYRYVAAFDEAGLGKALAPCVDQIGRELLRQCAENRDDWHRRLLCARGERPSNRRTTVLCSGIETRLQRMAEPSSRGSMTVKTCVPSGSSGFWILTGASNRGVKP